MLNNPDQLERSQGRTLVPLAIEEACVGRPVPFNAMANRDTELVA